MAVSGLSNPPFHTKRKKTDKNKRCIGAKTPDPTTTRKVTLEYAVAAVNAFSHLPRIEKEGKKFRFVFTSGILTVREGRIWLPYAKEARRIGVCLLFSLLLFSPS
jgi:hypothetical protein